MLPIFHFNVHHHSMRETSMTNWTACDKKVEVTKISGKHGNHVSQDSPLDPH